MNVWFGVALLAAAVFCLAGCLCVARERQLERHEPNRWNGQGREAR